MIRLPVECGKNVKYRAVLRGWSRPHRMAAIESGGIACDLQVAVPSVWIRRQRAQGHRCWDRMAGLPTRCLVESCGRTDKMAGVVCVRVVAM